MPRITMPQPLTSPPPEAAQTPDLIVLKHNQKRVMVKRQKSYDVRGTTVSIFDVLALISGSY